MFCTCICVVFNDKRVPLLNYSLDNENDIASNIYHITSSHSHQTIRWKRLWGESYRRVNFGPYVCSTRLRIQTMVVPCHLLPLNVGHPASFETTRMLKLRWLIVVRYSLQSTLINYRMRLYGDTFRAHLHITNKAV